MKVEERIAKNAFSPADEPHIVVDQAICADCEPRFCLTSCPAHLYELVAETGTVRVETSGCLECGTCLIVCTRGALTWRYPCGGAGIRYRFG